MRATEVKNFTNVLTKTPHAKSKMEPKSLAKRHSKPKVLLNPNINSGNDESGSRCKGWGVRVTNQAHPENTPKTPTVCHRRQCCFRWATGLSNPYCVNHFYKLSPFYPASTPCLLVSDEVYEGSIKRHSLNGPFELVTQLGASTKHPYRKYLLEDTEMGVDSAPNKPVHFSTIALGKLIFEKMKEEGGAPYA